MSETKINNIEETEEMEETKSTLVPDVKTALQKEKARRAAKREAKKVKRDEARVNNPSFLGRHAGKIAAGITGAIAGGVTGYHIGKQAMADYTMETEPDIPDVDPVEIDGAPVAETIE